MIRENLRELRKLGESNDEMLIRHRALVDQMKELNTGYGSAGMVLVSDRAVFKPIISRTNYSYWINGVKFTKTI